MMCFGIRNPNTCVEGLVKLISNLFSESKPLRENKMKSKNFVSIDFRKAVCILATVMLVSMVMISIPMTPIPIIPVKASPGIIYVAKTGNDTTGDGSSGNPYLTIQKAIDVWTIDNETIQVGDGTYTQDLTIDGKTDLTLKSANGTASTTIEGVTGVTINVTSSDNFMLGGTDHGFTVKGHATASTILFQITDDQSGITIRDNIFDLTGTPSQGISVVAGASSLTIDDNTFQNAGAGDEYIEGLKVSSVTVRDNTLTGTGGYGINFTGVTGTSSIARNTISNIATGIAIFNGEGTSGLTISANTISSCTNGIRLGQYTPTTNGDMTTVTVRSNTLSSNTIGLRIDDGANVKANQFTVDFNRFQGNTKGLDNDHATLTVTAEMNWWNHATGPSPAGSGDPVEGLVDYTPWLTGIKIETTTSGTDTVDAKSEADIYVTKEGSGTPTVTCAKYSGNPTGSTFTGDIGKYYDVRINSASDVTSLTLRFYYTDADIAGKTESLLKMYRWSGSWILCKPQTIHMDAVNGYSGYIEVIVTDTSTPTLSQLVGTPFGIGKEPTPVGGIVIDNDFELFAPWIGIFALAIAAIVTATITIKRRKH